MSEPTVCCVMLTRDRPAMAARAVRAFRAQTYQNKRLMILDTGERPLDARDIEGLPELFRAFINQRGPIRHCYWRPPDWRTIGYLRNEVNHHSAYEGKADILCHWDDDDYSHPNRLSEQVALLQASGADCVGYNECLFWDTRTCILGACAPVPQRNYQAWLYRCPSPTYGLGSSLCYWRKAWEQKPFADINHGEDMRFITGLKVLGLSANWQPVNYFDNCAMVGSAAGISFAAADEPRMICSIHGTNTSVYAPEKDRNMWKRAADWDAYCQEMMKL